MTNVGKRDDGGMYHLPGDRKYPSVTTVLNRIPKPGLEQWKANTPDDEIEAVTKRAQTIGSVVHRRCLNPFSVRELPTEPVPMEYVGDETFQSDVEVCCALFGEVLPDLPIDDDTLIEHTLWSDHYGYAGTADIITDDAIIDLKTSRRIYDSVPLQLAAYAKAAWERGIAEPTRAAAVHLDYRTDSAQIHWFTDLDTPFRTFVELLNNDKPQK